MGIFDSKVGQLLGLNKDISSGRLSICKKCPLMLNRYGRLICNDKMWLNPETGDFSTTEKDGYNAIQLGAIDKKANRANKAEIGSAKKANTTPKRFLKEIRDYEGSYNIGDEITADLFTVGEIVDVTGTTKGKGFAGVIKRHNQSRGPMGHGSHYHRRPGSLGTMLPKRVLKGKKLAGHMGVETVTIQNLEIIETNTNENYILISGNVPGAKNSIVLIKTAIKGNKKVNPKEIISYEESVVDAEEVVTPVETETVTEVKEDK